LKQLTIYTFCIYLFTYRNDTILQKRRFLC